MAFVDLFFKKEEKPINESIDYFKKFHPKQSYAEIMSTSGEGIEELQPVSGYGVYGKNEVKSFNVFHNRYIDFQLKNESDKIKEYRNVARMPEVADVIEDVVNESTQSDFDGRKISLVIRDSQIKTNDNITKLLQREFDTLFNQRLEFNKIIEDLILTYYVDGRVYWENVIDVNKPKRGLLSIKRLPTETMDFVYNVISSKVEFYVQYLKESKTLPNTIEDAKNCQDIIAFWPEQIGYLDYGQYGANKKDVMGYLEKVKAPYNQVKLLETAVVIYRLVRAPERLVFTIDVGNMPRNKAMKFVEGIKLSMQRKEVYDPNSGKMSNQPDVMCIRKNTEIRLLDGRVLPLTEVIKEFNEGKENYVYSINRKTLIVEPGKIINGAITRKDEKLIRIHLDNDAYLDTTYDHKFIKRDNTDCRADELKVGDALMPFDKTKSTGHKVEGYENHNIVAIEYLEETDDCGCITVEGNHNFAVYNSSQDTVFINNSILENYFLPSSCIIPNTYIKLYDGRDVKMSDIIVDYNNGVTNYVYSINQETQEVIKGKIAWAGYTRKNAKLISVTLSTREEIICTPDHKFVLKDGKEVEAQNLTPDTELSSLDASLYVYSINSIPYKSDTCCLTIEDPGDNHNFALSCGVFIKNSEGRGSTISTVGGNPSGFTELDDLYFFHRKMYRALKYPTSRVDSTQEKQSRDNMYQATSTGEITRDEVKWGTFLKKHQDKFSEAFLDLFMLHLALRGIAKEFGIKRSMLYCEMTVPNNYISQMHQLEQATRWDNYSSSNTDEFSVYWRMKKFLKLTDEEILANSSGFKRDRELGFKPAEEQY